jgi:uncharacterized glyoxalase superfamily metalloenzyme YdcJ
MRAHELRAAFAVRMAAIYGREVPAYTTLVAVAEQVNAEVTAHDPQGAARLGSLQRVTAERHGAIRLGTPAELRQAAQIFAALGMYPVGFYDLRDTDSAVPVVSTAFRPIDPAELARNPFRMFTSLLVTDDRRFFSADLQQRLDAFLSSRTVFPSRLLQLAEQAVARDGLQGEDVEEFLVLLTAAFTLSAEPIDHAWYRELSAVSGVAADIGGVRSTHINHLTPRVLDIDELYRRMAEQGIEMIEKIQGPPSWDGPDVLLRQTSFRALDERCTYREPDGALVDGHLRVRFGEVEARGIALTPIGRAHYDRAVAERDAHPDSDAAEIWARIFPRTESELFDSGLAYYEVQPDGSRTPIVYEDFLPASAAGIFASNLAESGSKDAGAQASARDADWLSDVMQVAVEDPFAIYAAQQQASLERSAAR